jgi:hypothetical protein
MAFRVGKKNTLFGKPKDEVIKHPGSLRRAAQRAGRTSMEEAEVEKDSSDPKLRKRGTLGATLMKMHK